jgi:hypothetical protein
MTPKELKKLSDKGSSSLYLQLHEKLKEVAAKGETECYLWDTTYWQFAEKLQSEDFVVYYKDESDAELGTVRFMVVSWKHA